MIRHLSLSAAVLGLALAVSGAANATPVSVDNPSFETLPPGGLTNGCGAGCSYSTVGTPIPGWTNVGSGGQFQPGSGGGSYFNSIPAGITVAYTNGGTISQTLSSTAFANQTYQLLVDLGFRKDQAEPGTISLTIGGQTIFATGGGTQNSGDWATYTATLLTTAFDAGVPITIALTSGGNQGDFDNVRLDTIGAGPRTTVPEPFTLSLFGVGLVGAAALRRRKTRKA